MTDTVQPNRYNQAFTLMQAIWLVGGAIISITVALSTAWYTVNVRLALLEHDFAQIAPSAKDYQALKDRAIAGEIFDQDSTKDRINLRTDIQRLQEKIEKDHEDIEILKSKGKN